MQLKDKDLPQINQELLDQDGYLKKTVQALVDHYHPIQIYLFGSKARSDDGPDSDYDLLVVVKRRVTREKKVKFHQIRWELGLNEATDVVVISEKWFRQRSTVKCSLPSTVIEEGKLLYAV